jgi:TolA-binding protein
MAAGPCPADVTEQLKQAGDYIQNKQYEQAEAIYLQIVTDYPGSDYALEAQKQLTILYIKQDNQPRADAALQQLISGFYNHKDIAKAVNKVADHYGWAGKYEKAITNYQKVVDNCPDYQYAWSAQYLIGSCYEKLKYYNSLPESEADPKIEQAYKSVVENYPDSAMVPSASLKLGYLDLKRGQKIEAAIYFELFLATARPNDPRIERVEIQLEELKG